MNEETTSAQEDQPQQAKQSGPIGRMIGVIFSPQLTFQNIARKPDWLVPFLLVIIVAGIMGYLMQPLILQQNRQVQQEKLEERGMSQEEIDQVLERSSFIKYIIVPAGVVATAANLVITALIWLFIGNIILSSETDFKHVFSVSVYRSIIPVLGGLIKLPIILSKESLNVHFSPAIMMSDELKDTFLYKLLASLDLFNIWMIVVLCIGLAAVYKFKVNKVWPVVVILYAIYYLGAAAASSIF